MAGYLVERYLPGLTAADVHDAVRRMTTVTEEMAAEGTPIRYLTSAFIAEEEACFCQFEALSREVVAAANERAAFPYARILAVDLASAGQKPPIRHGGAPASARQGEGRRPATPNTHEEDQS
jgi:hypothetical protein